MLFPRKRSFKTFLVTGSSSGIGKRIADDLAAKGGKVIYHSRIEHKLSIPSNAIYKFCDLSNLDKSIELVDSIEKEVEIDCLVCSAGRTYVHPANDTSLNFSNEDSIRTFNDIVYATTNICKVVLPRMIRRKRGRVVIIGGDVVDRPNSKGTMCSYAMAKAAVHQYAMYLTQELKSLGAPISVNVVAPAGVIRENESYRGEPSIGTIPTSDVSEAVCQLCLSNGDSLNGQIIRISNAKTAY